MDYAQESKMILERIYAAGKDIELPVPSGKGVVSITLYPSHGRYNFDGLHYPTVDALYDELVESYRPRQNENGVEYDLYLDLQHFDPGVL
ncbi:hypothetical protein [Desulfocurvus sp. DL9XJH121]